MKKLLAVIGFMLAAGTSHAQIMQRLQNASPDQRKELIKNMSAEERKNALRQVRENMLVEDLGIQENNKESFKKLYNEYQSSQRQIKSNFAVAEDPNKLSDTEAEEKLDQSFTVSQKLMDNRRVYAKKMRAIMKPQQILQLFQTEGMMRDKIMDRRAVLQLREDSADTQRPRDDGRRGFRPGTGDR